MTIYKKFPHAIGKASRIGAVIAMSVAMAGVPSIATAQRAAIMTLTVQGSGYETWGRPAGMDNPKAGCGSFNDAKPVSKFNVSLQVQNNSATPMTNWYLRVFNVNGSEAYVCYYGYDKGLPTLAKGQMVNVTFAAFMDSGVKAARVYVESNIGRSSEVRFNAAGVATGNSSAAAAVPTAAPSTATGRIAVAIQNSGYEQWGRPAGMDNPKLGCGSFNDKHIMHKYNLSIAVTNNARVAMTDWFAHVFKANGAEAYVCYYEINGGLPGIPPGQTVNVTFSAFMEPNEAAARLVIEDSAVGRSAGIALR